MTTVTTSVDVDVDLDDFSDQEIRHEYEERFGGLATDDVDEIADLIAEASFISKSAACAYELLREMHPYMPTLEGRRRILRARISEAA